jgi:predicted AAA+ superfamily ATPase
MIARNMEETLKRVAKAFPVIAILGPRQSGKTTLAKTLFNKHKYISFEEVIEAREEAINDPHGFLHTHMNEHGIILDEFQHVPSLLSYIQLYVDKNRKPGFFILTGSQNFLMNQAISQTLAGRVAIVNLLPLSIGELRNAQLLPNFIEELVFYGNYPEKYVNPHLDILDWYQNYIATYLERDVRDIRKVDNLTIFKRFMRLCAARVGQIIDITSLANDCDIDFKTARAWLSVLEASYIIFFLQPYSDKFTRRLIKSPKLFFYDTGLARSLLGIESLDELKLSSYRGNLIESLIISEIAKLYYNRGREPRIYFLRDKTGHEIDCVIEKSERLISIEIKAKMTASKNLFDGIEFWKEVAHQENIPLSDGYLIYSGNETQKRPYGTFLSWKDIDILLEVIQPQS